MVDTISSNESETDPQSHSGTIISGANAFLNVLGSTANYYATDIVSGTENLYIGGTDSGTLISSGGNQEVFTFLAYAGSALSATVFSGGFQDVFDGGYASGTVIEGGTVDVSISGLPTDSDTGHVNGIDYVNSANGSSYVASSGGSVVSTTIYSGVQQVFDGGTASGTIISGGTEAVFGISPGSVGSSFSATVYSGGTQDVFAGGFISGTAVSGGTVDVDTSGVGETTPDSYTFGSSGGFAVSTTLSANGVQKVFDGGTASGTVVAGGTELVYDLTDGSAGSSFNATVYSGRQDVLAGGFISGTTVFDGTVNVYTHALSGAIGSALIGDTLAFSGGFAVSTTINSGLGSQLVFDGGTASGTMISGGAEEIFGWSSAGYSAFDGGGSGTAGSSYNATVYSGGSQDVAGGGLISGTLVSGGAVYVDTFGALGNPEGMYFASSGGLAVSTTIYSGYQDVFDGGTASGTIISGGAEAVFGLKTGSAGSSYNAAVYSGYQDVFAGGFLSGTTVSGGTVYVDTSGALDESIPYNSPLGNSGGLAVSTTIYSGYQEVFDGGVASNTIVRSGEEDVYDGGIASGTAISGSEQAVYTSSFGSVGGSSFTTSIYDNGYQAVFAGGVASGTVIYVGEQDVYTNVWGKGTSAAGSAFDTKIYSNGYQDVYDGGVVSGTLLSGGYQEVETFESSSGGSAYATTIFTSGYQNVQNGGLALGTVISAGTQEVYSGGMASGTVIAGGTMIVDGGTVVGDITFAAAGTLQIGSATSKGSVLPAVESISAVSGDLTTPGSYFFVSGALVSGATSGTGLDALQAGDEIDITGLVYSAGGTVSVSGGILIVTEGSTTVDFALNDPQVTNFLVTSDGSGATLVTDTAPVNTGGGGGGGGAAATAPTITGLPTTETANGTNTTLPFAGVTVSDSNGGASDTLTISQTGGGSLAGNGLVIGGDGTYTLTGSSTTITNELEALVFTPLGGAPNTSNTTTFALTDTSSALATPATASTVITDVVSAVGPTITGTHSTATQSEGAVTPFAGVTIGDSNDGASETLTITPSGAGGTLSGSGLIVNGDGSYSLNGTVATVNAALATLSFVPTAGAAGTSSTTTFTLLDLSNAGGSVSDSSSQVVDSDPSVQTGGAQATNPSISGTHVTNTQLESAVTPFSGVTITDPNGGATDTLIITLQGNGILSGTDLSGGTGGIYTLAGLSAAALTTDLEALVFTPGAASPGSVTTTTFQLSDTSSAGTSASDATTQVIDTAAALTISTGQGSTGQTSAATGPTLTVNPKVDFTAADGFVLSGTVSNPDYIASIYVYGDVNGKMKTLGSAAVAADGSWSFYDQAGSKTQTFMTVVAIDGSGNQTTVSTDFDLTSGIKGQPYVAEQDKYDSSANFTGQTFFKADGKVYYNDSYTPTADGGSDVTYSGGTFFKGKTYDAFTDHYTANGALGVVTLDNRDGSHSITAQAAGQSLQSVASDTMNADGFANTTFVFTPGFGQDLVTDFKASGSGHDELTLSATDFGSIAAILHNTKNQAGSAVITDPTSGDTITLQNVTTAELKAHKSDFHLA